MTPPSLAAANGSAEMLAALLEAGADPNVTMAISEAAILTAERTGRADAVRALTSMAPTSRWMQAGGRSR